MAKVTLIQTNFTSGELSPRVSARVDIARYNNGAKEITNGFPQVQGGITYRWGTRFMGETKSSGRVRLVPYIFSNTQSYMLEVGDLYVRLYNKDGQILSGGSPYEIVSPYTIAQALTFDYVQGADTMFIASSQLPIQRLRRFGNTNWDFSAAPFEVTPFDEIGIRPAVGLTLSLATVGTGRTATASAAAFLASDVGRSIAFDAGIATITGFTSTTVVTVSITSAFPSVSLVSGSWKLTLSPQTVCTPSAKDPLNASITLTLTADGWRSDDVGKYVKINGGLVLITGYTSALIVTGKIKRELTATVGAEALSWSLNASVWNAVSGYPVTVSLHEQRLWAAGSVDYPQTIWGSRLGEYLDFTPGVNDDDAPVYPIASDQLNPIKYLASGRSLLAMSSGGEFTIDGGTDKTLSPLNVQSKFRTNHGCASVRPVRIFKDEAFIQRAGKKVRLFGYDGSVDDWAGTDITKLSDHLFSLGITDMAFIQEPEPMLFCIRSDGQLITATIDKEEQVLAWARQDINGVVESIASMQVEGGEQVWLSVNRTINGAEKRYIEVFDTSLTVDSAISGTTGAATKTWGGLGHLEGESVSVVADGIPIGEFTVSGGEVVLSRTASTVMIGLPYTMRLVMLTPEVQTQAGTAQGNAVSISEVSVRVLNSVGMKVNGQYIEFRKFGVGVLDSPIAPYSGYKKLPLLGWGDGEAELVIEHEQPLPFTLLSVIRKVTVNEG